MPRIEAVDVALTAIDQAVGPFPPRRSSTRRRGSRTKHQCILVIIGATPEGKKELVGFTDGVRESAQSWRDLLLDLKREMPETARAASGM
jgi:hypothetical protein